MCCALPFGKPIGQMTHGGTCWQKACWNRNVNCIATTQAQKLYGWRARICAQQKLLHASIHRSAHLGQRHGHEEAQNMKAYTINCLTMCSEATTRSYSSLSARSRRVILSDDCKDRNCATAQIRPELPTVAWNNGKKNDEAKYKRLLLRNNKLQPGVFAIGRGACKQVQHQLQAKEAYLRY